MGRAGREPRGSRVRFASGDFLVLLREVNDLLSPTGVAEVLVALGLERTLPRECRGGLPRDSAGGSESPSAGAALEAAADEGFAFLSRGGKFLRPLLTLAAYDAVVADRGGLNENEFAGTRCTARAAALAIEVFHKASLIHDDIEDGDLVRYGGPSVHASIGVPAAVNVGDFLVGLGYAIVAALASRRPSLNGVADDSGLSADLVGLLANSHLQLARGQGAELWWRDASSVRMTPADVIEFYGLKTSPAFEAALAMGVRIAGLRPSEAGPLEEFARHVGNGFQILNDLKDWEGDLENSRRPAGDLLGGRPNLLVALALENLSATDAGTLRSLLDRRDADLSEVSRLLHTARVFSDAAGVAAAEKDRAAAAAARCGPPRLAEVLGFLLELAIPAR
jgi:geranylgeranyl pyrophosphate synthase